MTFQGWGGGRKKKRQIRRSRFRGFEIKAARRDGQGMKKEEVLGLIRHILTFGGGVLVAMGSASEGDVTELVGGLVTVIGAVWSIVEKRRRA